MTSEQLDLLTRALYEVGMREVRYYESLPQKEYIPSARFEKRMAKLRKTQKMSIYPLIKSPMRKSASVLIVIILIFSMSLSVSAIRKPIFSFFERVTEKFTEIIFTRSMNNDIFTRYQVDWIPENYEFITETASTSIYRAEWKNQNSFLCLNQYANGSHVHLDTENAIIHQTIWNEREISYYQKHDTYLFSWTDGEYLFTLTCPTDLPLSDIQRMIESIHPVETAPS